MLGQLNAYGSYALLNDRDPRTLFRRNRYRGDIRQDVEHFHSPGWWKREFAKRFTVLEVIPLEIFSPVIAKVAGYHVDPRWTRADVRVASHLPKELASEVIFVLQQVTPATPTLAKPWFNPSAGAPHPSTAPLSSAAVRCARQ